MRPLQVNFLTLKVSFGPTEECWASGSSILAVRDILGSVGVELWHLRVEARLLRVEYASGRQFYTCDSLSSI